MAEQSTELLRELHLLTRNGDLNADALRKLKQVNHFVGLLKPAVEDIQERFGDPIVVDAGSGNAYLGFILYELFFKSEETGTVWNVESREALSQRSKERALRLGFGRMQFQTARVEEATLPDRIHLVMALHACDTATDDALALALKHNADHIALVPCCQAEVAQQLKEQRAKAGPAMQPLFEHPWHRREFGSHLTNVIRALVLESQGYRVTVTELTGWEHSLKNELILGRRIQRENRMAKERLDRLLRETQASPKIIRQLGWMPQ